MVNSITRPPWRPRARAWEVPGVMRWRRDDPVACAVGYAAPVKTSRVRWIAIMALAFAIGCDGPVVPSDAGTDAGREYVPEPFAPTAATMAYCEGDDSAIEERITTLLRELTPAEKIELMHGASSVLANGVWLASANERLGIPGLHMLDGPRGLSAFSEKNGTAFPVGMMRGATWDPELERRVGAAMGRELASAGADVLLAPTVNILRHPRWGRAQETYGEDTFHIGSMAVGFIEGVQSEGVLASVKHFAANSIEDTRHEVNVEIDERSLREIYLPHFRRAVQDARAGSVMSAYNQVNGQYCDLNHHLLTDILKGEWEFAGLVESDWILGTHGDSESVLAGLDIEMPTDLEFSRLGGALARGEITEADLDGSVRRILRAQLCFSLDGQGADDPSARETPEHLALAREVAERGIVLLEDRPAAGETTPVLPLDAASLHEIVVLGRAADVENIGDRGSSSVTPSDVVTALEGIQARAGSATTITHLAGDTLSADDEAAVARADAAVIVTGLLADDEGEAEIGAGDRASLELAPSEVALVRAVAALNPRVIVVLEGGAAITVSDWVEDIEALLFAFYPGERGGEAIAAILFGDVNPSGRLPFSVPVREADLPTFDNTSATVTYGYFHGYRHLEHEGITPAYPFGFGRSYTSFDLDNLALSTDTLANDGTLTVTVDVTNTGAMRGIETVQVYIAVPSSRVERAPKDLRGFVQVALAPAETQTVSIDIAARDLAFYDVDAAGWEVEPTDYTVLVGTSAADTPLTAGFRVP